MTPYPNKKYPTQDSVPFEAFVRASRIYKSSDPPEQVEGFETINLGPMKVWEWFDSEPIDADREHVADRLRSTFISSARQTIAEKGFETHLVLLSESGTESDLIQTTTQEIDGKYIVTAKIGMLYLKKQESE